MNIFFTQVSIISQL